MTVNKLIGNSAPKSQKFIIGCIVFIFIFAATGKIAAYAFGLSHLNKLTANFTNKVQARETTDLRGFLEYSINKECGKTNNLKNTTIRNTLITEDKTLLANINADEGEDKTVTKNKIFKDTLAIMKDIKDKDFTLITFSYFLPVENKKTLKTEDEQVLTVVFEKNQITGKKLDKVHSADLPEIAKSIVIYTILK